MVFYFTLMSDPTVVCYMGRDKYENEDLIRWGWPEDIWFHVDALSSAHVYVRMPRGKGMDDLSPAMIEECCQLTKANSIQGCKQNHVRIVYTPWANLRKSNDMEVGQVSFHDESQRRYHTIERKDNVLLNRLEKTRVERDQVDFRTEREQRDAEVRRLERLDEKARREAEAAAEAEKQRLREQREYAALMDQSNMRSNQARPGVSLEDDFM
jgi:hypothetical protein